MDRRWGRRRSAEEVADEWFDKKMVQWGREGKLGGDGRILVDPEYREDAESLCVPAECCATGNRARMVVAGARLADRKKLAWGVANNDSMRNDPMPRKNRPRNFKEL